MTKSTIDLVSLSSNPRATYTSWQKYRDVITAAMAVYPTTYSFAPSNMTPATVASRLRDAVRGCIAFHYDGPDFSQKLSPWWDEMVVRYNHTAVFIGLPEQKLSELVVNDVKSSPDVTLSFDTLTHEEFHSFALLLSNGRILGPVVVKTPLRPTVDLTPYPNLQVISRPDGSLVLL